MEEKGKVEENEDDGRRRKGEEIILIIEVSNHLWWDPSFLHRLVYIRKREEKKNRWRQEVEREEWVG